MAPTGSSTRTRSKNFTEHTTSAPPTAPMRIETGVVTVPTAAVMATRPARGTLAAIETIGVPSPLQLTIIPMNPLDTPAPTGLPPPTTTTSTPAPPDHALNHKQP